MGIFQISVKIYNKIKVLIIVKTVIEEAIIEKKATYLEICCCFLICDKAKVKTGFVCMQIYAVSSLHRLKKSHTNWCGLKKGFS